MDIEEWALECNQGSGLPTSPFVCFSGWITSLFGHFDFLCDCFVCLCGFLVSFNCALQLSNEKRKQDVTCQILESVPSRKWRGWCTDIPAGDWNLCSAADQQFI